MARDNLVTQSAIAKAGGIGPLLALLSSRSSAAQSHGMAALAQLRGTTARTRTRSRSRRASSRSSAPRDERRRAAGPLVGRVRHHGDLALQPGQPARGGRLWRHQPARQPDEGVGARGGQGGGRGRPVVPLGGPRHQGRDRARGDDRAARRAPRVGGARAQEHAGALGRSAEQRENQVQITQLLIELLTNGARTRRSAPHRAVGIVSENPSAHEAIAWRATRRRWCSCCGMGSRAKDYSLWALSLSISADNQGTVLETGGVQPLIDQLADARTVNQQQAAAALAKLARDNEETQSAIAKLGGVKPLIKLLELNESVHGGGAVGGAAAGGATAAGKKPPSGRADRSPSTAARRPPACSNSSSATRRRRRRRPRARRAAAAAVRASGPPEPTPASASARMRWTRGQPRGGAGGARRDVAAGGIQRSCCCSRRRAQHEAVRSDGARAAVQRPRGDAGHRDAGAITSLVALLDGKGARGAGGGGGRDPGARGDGGNRLTITESAASLL